MTMLASLLVSFLPTPPVSAAADPGYVKDVQRRKLLAMRECISTNSSPGHGLPEYFDPTDSGGNNIDSINDIFLYWNIQAAVIGTDLNEAGVKGVEGCKTAFNQGYDVLKALGPRATRFEELIRHEENNGSCITPDAKEKSDSFFACMLSGFDFQSGIEDKYVKNRRTKLEGLINDTVDSLNYTVSPKVLVFRTNQLIQNCYPNIVKYDAGTLADGDFTFKNPADNLNYHAKFKDNNFDKNIQSIGGRKIGGAKGNYWLAGDVIAAVRRTGNQTNDFEWQWYPYGYDQQNLNVRSDNYSLASDGGLKNNAINAFKSVAGTVTFGVLGPFLSTKVTVNDSGSDTNSFLNCSWVYDNKSTIFENPAIPLKINDDGTYSFEIGDVDGDGKADGQLQPAVFAPSSDGDENVKCETSGNPLSWLLCPIFNGLADFADWFFRELIQPFLYTPPISTDPDSSSFKVWSSFRIYGNIILIIALLLLVFGQTIGGGMIDAYTAKKMAPRILMTAILLNLSVYIVAAMVDITNIVGGAIGQVMLAPIRESGEFSFKIGAEGLGVVAVGLLGVLLSGGTLIGILSLLFTATGGGALAGAALSSLVQIGVFIGLAVVLPIVLALLGVFATLVIRKGILLALVIVAPVAFALYCLPNTEKYFQKWWELLFKTLLVYPIIIVIFAIADILSVTIIKANDIPIESFTSPGDVVTGGFDGIAALIVAFLLQFIPLFLIPFSFKIAGGTIGALYGAVSGGGNKLNNFIKNTETYKRSKQDASDSLLEGKYQSWKKLNKAADSSTGLRARGLRGLARKGGGYNPEAAIAERNARRQKEFFDTINTGPDDLERAASVDKALSDRKSVATRRATHDGKEYLEHTDHTGRVWRRQEVKADGSLGNMQYATMAGNKFVGESIVDQAASMAAANPSWLQSSLTYEMQKAQTEEDMQRVRDTFGDVAAAKGFNADQTNEMWIGSAFAKQNENRSFKNYAFEQGEDGAMVPRLKAGGQELLGEMAYKKGAYESAMQHKDNWDVMNASVEAAKVRKQAATEGRAVTFAERDEAAKYGIDLDRMGTDEADKILQHGKVIADNLKSGAYAGLRMAPGEEGGSQVQGGQGPGYTTEAIKAFASKFDDPTPTTGGGGP
jgi:hypothetical protein